MTTSSAATFETVVEPRRGPFSVDWRALWHYRDLLLIFARLEYATKVKQTLLGPLWYILHPLLTSFVFVGIFTRIVGVPSDGVPPLLFYLCGLMAWNYFAQCLGSTATFLTQHSHLFKKVYLPRLIVPLSIVVAKLLPLAIQLAVFLVLYAGVMFFTPAGTGCKPSWTIVLLPFYVLQIALLALGLGLCLATLSIRHRDLQHVVGVLVQLWMYATPVIYPATSVPPGWRGIIALNPMAPVVEGFRQMFFGTSVSFAYIATSSLLTAILCVTGLVLFHRAEGTLADTI